MSNVIVNVRGVTNSSMENSSHIQMLLSKMQEYYRLSLDDSDLKIRSSMLEIVHLWPELLTSADKATDDELFGLNVSRATIAHVFTTALSKDLFDSDAILVRKTFFTCFNILVKHNYIFKCNEYTSFLTFIDSNVRLLLRMLSSIVGSIEFQLNDFSEADERLLLITMREHIDDASHHDNLSDDILSLVWNLSDKTILVPLLVKLGYATSVLEWARNREKKFTKDRLNAPLHVLHNLLRHEDGIDQLNSHNALEVIESITTENSTCDDYIDLTIHITMIRALLTDKNRIKMDRTKYTDTALNIITQLCVNAAKSDRYRYEGTHISEPLTVLVKLFYNDELLQTTLNDNEAKFVPELISCLQSLFIEFYSKINISNRLLDNYTCVVILNLFWLISNHQQYRSTIQNNEQFFDMIKQAAADDEKFVDIFMPRTLKSIKVSAINILENLNC